MTAAKQRKCMVVGCHKRFTETAEVGEGEDAQALGPVCTSHYEEFVRYPSRYTLTTNDDHKPVLIRESGHEDPREAAGGSA